MDKYKVICSRNPAPAGFVVLETNDAEAAEHKKAQLLSRGWGGSRVEEPDQAEDTPPKKNKTVPKATE